MKVMLNLTLNSPTKKYFTEYQMLWDIKLNKIGLLPQEFHNLPTETGKVLRNYRIMWKFIENYYSDTEGRSPNQIGGWQKTLRWALKIK